VSLYAETGDIANTKYRDNVFVTPELANLNAEATAAGAAIQIRSNGALINAVDLRNCSSWGADVVNCVLLQRAEARFGNGDKIYDVNEQTRALVSRYNAFFGPHTFLGSGRSIRLGLELNF
jgi:hypothetical protein